ncbi:hypothetical protein JIX56_27455 [Streptomyces sp. CA-210063]|uniref:hypothetical protein n=1 Tax=Streptomyces sp. CA-210063 TaxID=2801029 RepID=UPI00214AFD69|nr:hypothetical protein [Streptomyces sp. CA-210063]UUU33293.1 hypothetical protein JIX56_27455 [Streptomyces sp. CA-210063]
MSLLMQDAERRPAVPLRLDVERWATFRIRKRVLAVVHTVTSARRLLDAVRLLEGDPRVQVLFTVAGDVFNHGVDEFLENTRALVVPWGQAVHTRFDLALAASYGSLYELSVPVIVLPHGASYNKRVSVPDDRRGRLPAVREVYGLGRQWLVRDGVVVPAAIVLAHEDDRTRLGRECPEALPVAEVVGDPCYDRVAASLPARDLYRRALGAALRQELVLVCSTWGPDSLLGRHWDLLELLAAQLPREDFRIVVMLHSNVWNAHSEWHIRSAFAGLSRCGVGLVSQHAEWSGAVVAADYIVGDHGSVSLYGAMTGARLLTAGSPDTDLDPSSPMAELRSLAPRIDMGRPLLRQLRQSAAAYRPDRYARVAARISSEPGRFARRMRALLYRKLRLRAPVARPAPAAAVPPVLVRYDEPGGAES